MLKYKCTACTMRTSSHSNSRYAPDGRFQECRRRMVAPAVITFVCAINRNLRGTPPRANSRYAPDGRFQECRRRMVAPAVVTFIIHSRAGASPRRRLAHTAATFASAINQNLRGTPPRAKSRYAPDGRFQECGRRMVAPAVVTFVSEANRNL